MSPLSAFYGWPGKKSLFLVSQVRYHYQKSVSYLALSYLDPERLTFENFVPSVPSQAKKKQWFDLFHFNPGSGALNKWYFEDLENGPLSYAYLMAPEVHWKKWTAARGPEHLFVVTEFIKGTQQGLRGWVLKEGMEPTPLALPGFTVKEEFITASPAIAADNNGNALLVYEADRGVDDCVIMGRIVKSEDTKIEKNNGGQDLQD